MKALAADPGTGRFGFHHHTDFHLQQRLRWCQDLHRLRRAASSAGTEAASRRFAGMTSALKSKPASTELPLLAVSVPGGKAS
jgi:hypothetical protein